MSIPTTIIIICWAAFILFWFVSSFNIKRDISRGSWQRMWWLRFAVLFIVLGWLWGTSSLGKLTEHLWFIKTSSYGILGVVAALFCIAGIGLAIWARVHLGRNWSPAPALKEDHELITSGPYKLIRHPIYTGILVAVLGSAFTNPQWLIVLVLIAVMFVWRVKREEGIMTKQFPEKYPEYKKHTWALVPWVW